MKNHTPLLRSQEGASAIEFALISPVLLLFTIGIIEVSLMMLTQNIMESATFTASRLGKTGYVEAGETREETIINALNDSASGLIDTSLVTIESLSYSEFGDVGEPEPFVDANGNGTRDDGENFTDVNGNGIYDTDMGALSAGEGGEVVVYTVSYPWHITTPIMSAVMGEAGIFNLTARSVVKNEPF
jgi:hypothetical protein